MTVFSVPTRADVTPDNQALFDNLKKALGFVSNLYATFAHSPGRRRARLSQPQDRRPRHSSDLPLGQPTRARPRAAMEAVLFLLERRVRAVALAPSELGDSLVRFGGGKNEQF